MLLDHFWFLLCANALIKIVVTALIVSAFCGHSDLFFKSTLFGDSRPYDRPKTATVF